MVQRPLKGFIRSISGGSNSGRSREIPDERTIQRSPETSVSTKNTSKKRESIASAYFDVSERRDYQNVLPEREAFTSDLDLFDVYIGKMQNAVIRTEEDSPFNAKLWSHVRERLTYATPVGYTELNRGEYQLMTNDDPMQVITKCGEFGHLMPIFPNLLAEKSGVPLQEVLTELFYGASVGLVEMVWAPDCERCNGSVCQEPTIANLPSEATCGGCGHHNNISLLDNIKIYFVFRSDVFYLPVVNFECPHSSLRMSNVVFICCAFPSSTKSGYSYSFGKEETAFPILQKGRYRIVCAFSGVDCYLNVERDATEDDKKMIQKMNASEVKRPEAGMKNEINIPHGNVYLDMMSDTNTVFFAMCLRDIDDDAVYRVEGEERKKFTSATQCIHHPAFKKLFAKQIVNDSAAFTVTRVVLVFTDVVGSTALYESCGDGAALKCVKEHFKVLFKAFTTSGRVVKTVGDCVMAAFVSGEAAIEAVAKGLERMQKKCKLPNGQPLAIRVGMHCGPALMVALNGINDYFGGTVNVAARVESKATAHECLVTDDVLSEPGAMEAYNSMRSRGFVHSRDVELSLKGVDNPVRARGFQVKQQPGQ